MSFFGVLKRILYWSYERGTWQYDVMCVLILAFIFLIPASVFDDPEARSRRAGLGGLKKHVVPADPHGNTAFRNNIAAAIGEDEEVERIEVVRDGSGQIRAYNVWSRKRTR